MTTPHGFHLDPADRAAVAAQLGRIPRGHLRVAVRCPCQLPAVVETYPIVDGAPFPTLYWLTCVRARHDIGTLEASGSISDLNERLATDTAFRSRFDAAQGDYVRRRDALHVLPDAGGIGGGRLDRIKCLHAHYAHHLVCRCNPVGDWVDEHTDEMLRPPPCVDVPSLD